MNVTTAVPLLSAFAGYGVEIEYMIVDREHLNVCPLADRLLQDDEGRPASEVLHGEIGWSNELVLHVLELKNPHPVPSLEELPAAFRAAVREINAKLAPLDAQLMPGGMHPWMNPRSEAMLWPHENAAIYRSYDRIFDCRRHGWANLQSMQLNLPFAGDAEFARLHSAVRLVLPILPALAASSPWADGRFSGYMNYRLAIYRDHQSQVPSSMGDCIPEPSASPDEYRNRVLEPMYREIATYDAVLGADAGALSHEWLDVRAAVPRFSRSAIEIRLLDVQENPFADLAVAAAVSALVRRIYADSVRAPLPTPRLLSILEDCTRDAEQAPITDGRYLASLGLPTTSCRAGEAWQRLIEILTDDGLLAPLWLPPLRRIAEHGTLARRLASTLDGEAARLRPVYRQLCHCLRDNQPFLATD